MEAEQAFTERQLAQSLVQQLVLMIGTPARKMVVIMEMALDINELTER